MLKGVRLVLAFSAIGLASCSPSADTNDAQSSAKAGQKTEPATFESAFETSFHREYIASCVAGATKHGAAEAFAREVCTCGADTLVSEHSTLELMRVSDEQIADVMRRCRQESEQDVD